MNDEKQKPKKLIDVQQEFDKKRNNYRRSIVPEQLERARRRYYALVKEARELKLNWAMTNDELHDKKFDR